MFIQSYYFRLQVINTYFVRPSVVFETLLSVLSIEYRVSTLELVDFYFNKNGLIMKSTESFVSL